MKLNFVKVNPVENMTVFILDNIENKKHIEVSKKIMDYSNLYAEQVGFVENLDRKDSTESVRLQMMGGEFCGNATRSLAALLVYKNHNSVNKIGDNYYVDIETTCLNKTFRCVVEKIDDTNFMSQITMPIPKDKPIELFFDGKYKVYRIDFDGISHFIVDVKSIEDKQKLFELIKNYIEREDYEAFGIMFYDFDSSYLTPLVYVKATDSLFWEKSCASGTSALGSVLTYMYSKEVQLDVKQPGGILNIKTQLKYGTISSILLNGKVEIVAEGVVNV